MTNESTEATSIPTPPSSAIVFGGAGFIGTRLLNLLRDRGTERLVSADFKPPRGERAAGVEYIPVDVRRPIGIDEDFDVIYNFAAIHTTPGHEPHEYYEANIGGALNVTNFARAHDIKTIVFTSSISVYGPSEEQMDETSVPMPTSDYGKSKYFAEQIHRTWLREDANRKLIVVRPAVIFGHGESGNFDRILKMIRSKTFVYPGRTDTIKSCGYVAELVTAIEWVRDRETREALFNFAYPERTTIEQIATAIARADGQPAPKLNLPLGAMMQASRVFEVAAKAGIKTGINRERILKLVRSTNIFPGYLVSTGYPYMTTMNTAVEHWMGEESNDGAINTGTGIVSVRTDPDRSIQLSA